MSGSSRASRPFMRFTSLIVELIRARPRLVVWVVLLVQAAIWLLLPLLIYGSPPGDVAMVLAIGREYRVGSVGRAAFGILAGGHRVSRCRQSHRGRLSVGAVVFPADVLVALSARPARSSAVRMPCWPCCSRSR